MVGEYWTLAGPFGLKVRVAIRITQFILAIVIIAIQAADFAASHTKTDRIYAFVAASLSVIIDVTHCLATLRNGAWLIFDACLVILWAALAGAVGTTVYDGPEDEDDLTKRRRSIALATMSLAILSLVAWLASCFHGCCWCCARRRQLKATKNAIRDAQPTELVEVDSTV